MVLFSVLLIASILFTIEAKRTMRAITYFVISGFVLAIYFFLNGLHYLGIFQAAAAVYFSLVFFTVFAGVGE